MELPQQEDETIEASSSHPEVVANEFSQSIIGGGNGGVLQETFSVESADHVVASPGRVLTQLNGMTGRKRKIVNMVRNNQSVINSNVAGPSTSRRRLTSASGTSTAVTSSGQLESALNPLAPPDWEKLYNETMTSLTVTCMPFSIDKSSLEYSTIVDLMKPFTVVNIHKIVNTDVWESYQNQRKLMLKKKADELDVLLALGLDEIEAKARVRRAKNFTKDPLLSTTEGRYSLNEALLFYCIPSLENVDDILEEGLDERVGHGGAFGDGIYFADDPRKSERYLGRSGIILIFTVILGDCKDFGEGGPGVANLQREPEKAYQERRNFNDKFFDSITGRMIGSQYNEYVIFNRNQCCPLYEIEYRDNYTSMSALELAHQDVPECYSAARKSSPSIAWKAIPFYRVSSHNTPAEYYSMPNQQQNPPWPFLASILFKKMSVPSTTAAIVQPIANLMECPLCYEEILISASNWKKLNCNDEFCTSCYEKIGTKGTTMNGVEHMFVECPFCNKIDGVKIGNCCLSGQMIVKTVNTCCEGYSELATITINYIIEDERYALDRMTFLPDNEKGRKVAELLKVAWDRRLIFSIGDNMTSGASCTLIWNIHHKTSQKGGMMANGYPDLSYLDRVLEELASIGVK